MPRREVHVHKHLAASADAVWDVVRNFYGAWHPLIATIEHETGSSIRRFTVKGESTVYRERLTYFSDTDHTLSYKHVEGIKGVEDYAASLSVNSQGATCDLEWIAVIEADDPRLQQIAEGTRTIFEMGIAALSPPPVIPANAGIQLEDQLPSSKTFDSIAVDFLSAPSSTLCLFLHGIGGNRSNWQRQLPITAQFMQSAAMDLRGYGESRLGENPSTVEDYCQDILEVMQHFNTGKVVLCGLSYGAWLATSFAMRHPDKVKGLVLAGGCIGMSEAPPEERERFRQSREVPLNQEKTPRDFAPAVVNVITSPHATEQVRRELFESMAAIPAATYRDALQCFTNPSERFDFSKLNMPVLLLTGEHDRLASPQEIRSVALRIHAAAHTPNVRFEIIPKAGHVCNLENPDAFNTLLHEFLTGLAT